MSKSDREKLIEYTADMISTVEKTEGNVQQDIEKAVGNENQYSDIFKSVGEKLNVFVSACDCGNRKLYDKVREEYYCPICNT